MKCKNLFYSNLKDSEIREIMQKKDFDNIHESYKLDYSTRVICYHNTEYPTYLKNIKDFPPFLFVRGKRIDIKNSIGIVGTRKCSDEGINACKKIIKELSEYEDITIISGLANGIDSIALEESLKYNINTIAVIPTNIYDCYPIENENLKKYIEENGTVITEIRPEQNLQKLNFVMRNRIIAGLSRCIFIPESYKKGGSLITAKFAQLYDRDVFCTPSSIFNASFEGCNDLIKYNNAKLITSADDIASEFGWRKKSEKILGNC